MSTASDDNAPPREPDADVLRRMVDAAVAHYLLERCQPPGTTSTLWQ